MTNRKTIIYRDPTILAQTVAARTLLTIGDLLAEPGRTRVDIAVTGGTDGNRVFHELLASPLTEAVDWSRVHLWWGDERFVAADSDDRNVKQARGEFLDAMTGAGLLPEANIHPMPDDTRSADEIAAASPEETDAVLAAAAAEYQAELVAELGSEPALDIAMFGMGPDAHFASLFPGLPQVLIDDPHVLVAGVRDSPKPPPLRLTLTVPMIARSRHTWVFTSEERKAPAVAAAFAQPRNPQAPSSFADGQELLWLIDKGAASRLPRE
ncbi:6-phosphogluconolactonase [Bifidobacterium sp. SO1]|uniref:6-phosphogluconolactonase n=1 Tax=Bifidobacterium sp. SO1 TaxID=2809029 RepID=UPI001BDD504B|nr:6-phosphogluconolactonase [Bifidobacterium sp. SO1]MBT1160365.1 6-phosphogluconolactonase [Bifidobacterium sp. SO1]